MKGALLLPPLLAQLAFDAADVAADAVGALVAGAAPLGRARPPERRAVAVALHRGATDRAGDAQLSCFDGGVMIVRLRRYSGALWSICDCTRARSVSAWRSLLAVIQNVSLSTP